MQSLRHPNLLPMFCSFNHNSPHPNSMWLVEPFVAGGSLEDILQEHFPGGMVWHRQAIIHSEYDA